MANPETDQNPLQVIERRVQQRAAHANLDMSDPAATTQLQHLIRDELDNWSLDVKRGHRPHDLADPTNLAHRALRNLTSYGPLTELLDDPDVWEIMVNAPDQIFVKRHHGPNGYHHDTFHDDEHVTRTLTKLLDDNTTAHRKLDPSEGLQDAQLDTGARLHIVHNDIGRGGHLLINIRKFTGVAYTNLHELVDTDMLDHHTAQFLTAAINARASIIFAGAPGSGKTTLLSCCCAELDPTLRVVTAEEVFETDIPLANVAAMQTRPARNDRQEINLRRLVAGFLRMAPDIAIVGEVRDKEALPLLLTLSSGVKGYTTLHAGSARQALTRLRFICQLADVANELPISALNTLVCESIDLVVHCGRGPHGPRINEIIAVEDLAGGADATHFTVTELFTRAGPDAPLQWTGQIPARLDRTMRQAGTELRPLLDARGSTASLRAAG